MSRKCVRVCQEQKYNYYNPLLADLDELLRQLRTDEKPTKPVVMFFFGFLAVTEICVEFLAIFRVFRKIFYERSQNATVSNY